MRDGFAVPVIEFGIANATSSQLTAKTLFMHYRFGTVLRLNTASKCVKTRSRAEDCDTPLWPLSSTCALVLQVVRR
jgi:hypothetical protein